MLGFSSISSTPISGLSIGFAVLADFFMALEDLASLSFTMSVPIENEATAFVNFVLQQENATLQRRDALTFIDWGQLLTATQSTALEYAAGVVNSPVFGIEYSSGINIVPTIPVEWGGASSVILNSTSPVDWSSIFTATQPIPVEYSSIIKPSPVFPADYGNTVNIVPPIPVDWLAATSILNSVSPIDWGSILSGTQSSPAEYEAVMRSSPVFPIDNAGGVNAVPGIPVEWSGAASINLNSTSPLDWSTLQVMTGSFLVAYGNLVRADMPAPTEFGNAVGLSVLFQLATGQSPFRDNTSPMEYVSSIFKDMVSSIEYSGVVSKTITVPIAYSANIIAVSISPIDYEIRVFLDFMNEVPIEYGQGIMADLVAWVEWITFTYLQNPDRILTTGAIRTLTTGAVRSL